MTEHRDVGRKKKISKVERLKDYILCMCKFTWISCNCKNIANKFINEVAYKYIRN